MVDPGLEKTLAWIAGQQVRIDRFKDPSIRSAADRVLAGLDPGTDKVLLQIDADQEDGQKPAFNAALAWRIGDRWTIVGAYRKDWGSGQAGTIQVRFK